MTGNHNATGLLAGKFRRFLAVHCRKDYVARQLRVRQGDCHQCGTCCHFSMACPMLTKDKLCLVYGSFRPKACKVFPIDQKDIDDVAHCGGLCGYSFDAPSPKRAENGVAASASGSIRRMPVPAPVDHERAHRHPLAASIVALLTCCIRRAKPRHL
jgi:hypothetical protein